MAMLIFTVYMPKTLKLIQVHCWKIHMFHMFGSAGGAEPLNMCFITFYSHAPVRAMAWRAIRERNGAAQLDSTVPAGALERCLE